MTEKCLKTQSKGNAPPAPLSLLKALLKRDLHSTISNDYERLLTKTTKKRCQDESCRRQQACEGRASRQEHFPRLSPQRSKHRLRCGTVLQAPVLLCGHMPLCGGSKRYLSLPPAGQQGSCKHHLTSSKAFGPPYLVRELI